MRLLGYTRVSTAAQDAQLQIDALVKIGVHQRDIFSDVTSGTKVAASRPAMSRLLEYAVEGDTVVVWRIDRLGRSLIDVLNTVKSLQQAGIRVQSVSDGIDPSTKTGRMMLGMLATLAEYERELIVERVNAGIAVAQAAGTRFGRPVSDPTVIAKSSVTHGRTAKRPRRPPSSWGGPARPYIGTSRRQAPRRSVTLGHDPESSASRYETAAVGRGVRRSVDTVQTEDRNGC